MGIGAWVWLGALSLSLLAPPAQAAKAKASKPAGNEAAAVSPSGLPGTVAAALKKLGIPPEAMAMAAGPLKTAITPNWRVQADAPFNPASVMKLVTTYAALDLLGPDFTWNTTFWSDAPPQGGLLRGNLYIKGDGDPKWVVERIAPAMQAVQAAGAQVVHGDMVLDQTAFQLPAKDASAFDGEGLRPYNAAPEALLVNFKSVIFTFTPDPAAGVARVSWEPPLAQVAVDATVPLSNAACGDWRGGLQGRFDNPNALRFAGRYPASCGERTWPLAYPDAPNYAARALEGLWRANSGSITGQVRAGGVPPQAKLLHTAPSLPLSAIIADVNKFSNNVMAQQVFLTVGRQVDERTGTRLNTPVTGQFERSRSVVQQWWKRRFGTQLTTPVLDNGSGLSRQERISADGLWALLRDASLHPQGQWFVQSLAVAGVDGTAVRMGERGVARQALGNAWVKTGSLRDVAAIAGYVQTRSGDIWGVVGLINHANAPNARPALDTLLEWAAKQDKP